MSVLLGGGGGAEEAVAGWQAGFYFAGCSLLITNPDRLRFNIKSLRRRSDPNDYWKINTSPAVILDVYNHTRTTAKTGPTEDMKITHTHKHTGSLQTRPRRSRSDLLDWQRLVRFSCIYCCSPSECSSQFSSKLKALICHPVQSKFNASNYRGSASRQIWSEAAWQECLLRIRAF